MNTKKTLAALFISGIIGGIGGYLGGTTSSQNQVRESKTQVERLENQRYTLKRENYQLHTDLIKRDNPYQWELYGDELGSWGYRRPDNNCVLGASEQGYTYLESK